MQMGLVIGTLKSIWAATPRRGYDGCYTNSGKQRHNSGVLAVMWFAKPTPAQDFRGERDLAS
jgi:hypothetical protein